MMGDTKRQCIYIVDASSLIILNRFDAEVFEIPQRVWIELDRLLDDGIITSCRCVYDEIVTDSKKPDKVSAWLGPKQSHFPKPTQQQILYMAEAVNEFSGLVDPKSEKEQADPWIVAMARELSEINPENEYVVVTQENKNSPHKIPAACKKYGIRVINQKEFLAEVGIKLEV